MAVRKEVQKPEERKPDAREDTPPVPEDSAIEIEDITTDTTVMQSLDSFPSTGGMTQAGESGTNGANVIREGDYVIVANPDAVRATGMIPADASYSERLAALDRCMREGGAVMMSVDKLKQEMELVQGLKNRLASLTRVVTAKESKPSIIKSMEEAVEYCQEQLSTINKSLPSGRLCDSLLSFFKMGSQLKRIMEDFKTKHAEAVTKYPEGLLSEEDEMALNKDLEKIEETVNVAIGEQVSALKCALNGIISQCEDYYKKCSDDRKTKQIADFINKLKGYDNFLVSMLVRAPNKPAADIVNALSTVEGSRISGADIPLITDGRNPSAIREDIARADEATYPEYHRLSEIFASGGGQESRGSEVHGDEQSTDSDEGFDDIDRACVANGGTGIVGDRRRVRRMAFSELHGVSAIFPERASDTMIGNDSHSQSVDNLRVDEGAHADQVMSNQPQYQLACEDVIKSASLNDVKESVKALKIINILDKTSRISTTAGLIVRLRGQYSDQLYNTLIGTQNNLLKAIAEKLKSEKEAESRGDQSKRRRK